MSKKGDSLLKAIVSIVFLVLLAGGALLFHSHFSDDADVASQQISKAADNFEIDRRIVFYNGVNGEYILTVEGKCALYHEGSVDPHRRNHDQLEVVCKFGPDQFVKHFLGLSDNVSYFAEQLKTSTVSAYHYRVTFKPQALIPDIDFRFSGEDLIKDKSEELKDAVNSEINDAN